MASTARALIAACVLGLGMASAPAGASPSDGFWIGGSSSGPGPDFGGPGRYDTRGPHEVEVGVGSSFRYHSIMDGIKAVGAGGIVHVDQGLYVESLKITKPVTIVGRVNKPIESSKPIEIVVKLQAPPDEPCASVDVKGSGVVSLRQISMIAGPQNVQHACVELEAGSLAIKDSTITAPNYVSALLARGGNLSVETTTVTGGREGILITARDGAGTYYIGSNNTITRNITGIKVDGLAQANIVGNEISNNAADGVVYYQGRGSVIGNTIFNNNSAGLVLQNSPQSPTVRFNKIYQNVGNGIQIVPAIAQIGVSGPPLPESRGLICDNTISNNFGAGIDARATGLSIDCKNDLHGNRGDKSKNRGWFGGGRDRDRDSSRDNW
jgi:parallel beta-helix repeat protein